MIRSFKFFLLKDFMEPAGVIPVRGFHENRGVSNCARDAPIYTHSGSPSRPPLDATAHARTLYMRSPVHRDIYSHFKRGVPLSNNEAYRSEPTVHRLLVQPRHASSLLVDSQRVVIGRKARKCSHFASRHPKYVFPLDAHFVRRWGDRDLARMSLLT